MNDLPPRTSATMSDAIAMSSPSGRMSKRARKAAEKRLSVALFGPSGYIPEKPPQEDPVDSRLRRARDFRYMAARGMQVRTFSREAARLEAEAAALIAAGHVNQVR
jgi:hypothetical protein